MFTIKVNERFIVHDRSQQIRLFFSKWEKTWGHFSLGPELCGCEVRAGILQGEICSTKPHMEADAEENNLLELRVPEEASLPWGHPEPSMGFTLPSDLALEERLNPRGPWFCQAVFLSSPWSISEDEPLLRPLSFQVECRSLICVSWFSSSFYLCVRGREKERDLCELHHSPT